MHRYGLPPDVMHRHGLPPDVMHVTACRRM